MQQGTRRCDTNIIKTELEDVAIIAPDVFFDERGYFFEPVSVRKLNAADIDFSPVQENCAFSKKRGTLRGLHFQTYPSAQAKLVRCVQGSVLDIAVDLRKTSPHYLKYVKVLLSAENKKQLFIPRGFAHGVISLKDDTMIEYYMDAYFDPLHSSTIRFDDPQIAVDWETDHFILSEKDKMAEFLGDRVFQF